MPKVLVAEDKDDGRKLIKSMLEIYGHEVIEAENGAVAVEKTLTQNPDLILMDLAMPIMDGIEAVRLIRRDANHHRTPIICITAYGDQYAHRAHEAGCDFVVPKPIDFRELDPLISHFSRAN
jgi:CheY-like chemotaxis protein